VIGAFNTFFAVDLFLWIGGFFIPFVMLNPSNFAKLKNMGVSIIPGALLKRLIRICPCYYFCILINWGLEPYLAESTKQFASCGNNLWQNMLFISNFFPENNCFPWGWYLSVDM
jgi:peptidoglycan/LPS O-acetylase OafA/YrhL